MSNKIKKAFIILGDQLFPPAMSAWSKEHHVFMAEDYSLCTHYKYHKHKITFFIASMREYAEGIEPRVGALTYYDGEHPLFKKSFQQKISQFFKDNPNIEEVHHYEIADHFFNDEIKKSLKSKKVIEHANPMFMTSREEFSDYLNDSKPFMMTFYKRQRQKFNILLTGQGKPEGGQWSFDKENRKKYPKGIELPEPLVHQSSQNLDEVKEWVSKTFKNHPGHVDNFWLPVNRSQALKVLGQFINKKFHSFGPYEDAIKSDDVFGFHSVISPMLNNGLLTPAEVIAKAIEVGRKNKVPLSSIEGFVRQVIGWREFIRGIYDHYEDKMMRDNFWQHHNKMSESWYNGTTGLLPLDDSIKKANQYGYTHHIERLMILSNIMLLCELEPLCVYQWFMEMYVDSADWVMAANVFAMGQMSEGGIFSTKPYICGSNYILKMSDYKRGEWCDTLDGLYWRFVVKHRDFFASNPRMSMMAKMLDKIDDHRKKHIFTKAEGFIASNTM